MELRGSQQQQKENMGIHTSIGYNSHPSSRPEPLDHQRSSSSRPDHQRSSSLLAADEGRNNLFQNPLQTLGQLHLTQQQQQQQQKQQQQQQQHDDEHEQDDEALNADPDPDPGSNAAADAQPRTDLVPYNSVQYKACLKNHAASMGGHVIDGCGEFMPSGEEGTPEALKCAACECHRNFHWKEIDGEAVVPHAAAIGATTSYFPFNPAMNNSNHNHHRVHTQNPTPRRHYSRGPGVPPVMMAFGGNSGGGAPAESSSEDLNNAGGGGQVLHNLSSFSMSKKRFRTKFTQQQKDRMHEFAEKIGWKIQKQDEQQVLQFCNEVGVKRQVFKVWMHNNKQSLKKKQM